jgi:TPR repeat protein
MMSGRVFRTRFRVFVSAMACTIGFGWAQAANLPASHLLNLDGPAVYADTEAPPPPITQRMYRPHVNLAEIDGRYFETVAAEAHRPALIASYKAYKAARFQESVDLLKGADKDDRHVLLMRGLAYLALTGPETFKISMQMLERAADMKEPRAQLAVGLVKLVRTAHSAPDEKRGRELIELAAAGGDSVALRVLAEGYLAGWIGETSPARSIVLLKAAAAKGDAKASFRLAEHYFTGTGTAKDIVEAESHLIKSAEAGNTDAQAFLGTWRFLGFGLGLTDDAKPALEWLEKAAAANHPRALEYLGLFYAAYGARIGLTDLPRAVGYFKRCVETSADADCAFAYAQAFDNGIGLTQDRVTAIAMYSIANRDGLSINASRRMDELRRELSKADLARAVTIRDTIIKEVETLKGETISRAKLAAENAARMRAPR